MSQTHTTGRAQSLLNRRTALSCFAQFLEASFVTPDPRLCTPHFTSCRQCLQGYVRPRVCQGAGLCREAKRRLRRTGDGTRDSWSRPPALRKRVRRGGVGLAGGGRRGGMVPEFLVVRPQATDGAPQVSPAMRDLEGFAASRGLV